MQRFLKLIVFFLFSFTTITAVAQNNVIDEVVWVVGDDAILKSDIEKAIQQMKYEKSEIEGDPYCVLPEQLAVRKLFLHQAKLDSVEANEGNISMQVNGRINEMVAQIGSQEKLEEYFGKKMREIKEELREQAREQMLIQQVQQGLVKDIKISPADVRNYFAKQKVEDIPMIADKTEIQILSIDPPVEKERIEEVKERLRGYRERIESGDASFSMLATLYSDDLGSAKMGGELGFMGKAQLVKEFADEAFSLTNPEKVSRIIQTEYGFHIIQLIEKRGDKLNCRHILLKINPSIEKQQSTLLQLDSIANDIRTAKLSFESAVIFFSTDKDTRMSAGLMVNPQDGTTQFEYKDLPAEASKIAYELKVGEISNPFKLTNAAGKETCAIIKVKSKTAQHRANVEEDFQLLKSYVQNKKSAETIENWIKNKQKDTFVRINPDYQNCDFQYPNWIKK